MKIQYFFFNQCDLFKGYMQNHFFLSPVEFEHEKMVSLLSSVIM